MNEFIKVLIERLEEEMNDAKCRWDDDEYYVGLANAYEHTIAIVNTLAEEHKHCIKSSCSNCETYDKEKHYCPKWCDVIKNTVEEMKENKENDFCEWKGESMLGLYNSFCGQKSIVNPFWTHCPYCGKKIKVVE